MPDSAALPDEGLAEAIDRARRSIRDVSLSLDSGILTGAPTDAVETLHAAHRILDAIGSGISPVEPGRETTGNVLFDVSDMFGYFPDNRLPTGVQRVQISVILNVLDLAGERGVGLVRFVEGRDEWVGVPAAPFRTVCRLSTAGGDPDAADWRAACGELKRAVAHQPALAFPRGAFLVNLGTSWWLPNYFMYIRKAKIDHGIRYVPLIHDMIPVLRPSECHPDLVHDFIDWLMGVLQHADFFLANSDATKADLIGQAALLGWTIPSEDIAVTPLQADLARTGQSGSSPAILAQWGLAPGSFVLFVSTLETRKNQLGAFDAWQRLIGLHGKDRVPKLVCVGKRGFRSHEVFARRDASVDLQDKVIILEHVDDTVLEALYQQCLFTLYPSYYEGWGLPVTESLCYGKVPLTADNSSLPQAGAGLSVLFQAGSTASLVSALERLIYDDAFRREKETAIARQFKSRTWADVAADISANLRLFADRADARGPAWVPVAARPGFYPMKRNRETQITAGMGSAEIFRSGTGWWRLEDFGCWSRPGGGTLSMLLPEGTERLALELFGLPGRATDFTVFVDGKATTSAGSIATAGRRWVFLDMDPAAAGAAITIRIVGHVTETNMPSAGEPREIGVGLGGFYVFDPHNPRARLDFVEAVALGGLATYRQAATAA